jgi:DNA repair exonuclease SbcCD ATPase subunit
MALKLVHSPEPQLPPHRQALKDNLRAIKDTRARVTEIHDKDMLAAADIASADTTQGRIQTLQETIDTARVEATYNGDPIPDLRHLEKQLGEAQQLYKQQSDRARAAANVRQKYAADMAALNNILSAHARDTRRLTWVAAQEELASTAAELLAMEQQMLDLLRRVFAAALICDGISMEQAYGQFVGSANIHDLQLPRPSHPDFRREALTVEAAHAKRREYLKSIEAAAATLELELLAVAD